MIYYLPSCNFKVAHPELSKSIQKYLSEKGVQVIGCCRVSQNLFKAGDVVLHHCPACMFITRENSPEVTVKTLYQYLDEDESFRFPDLHEQKITIQDCRRFISDPGAMTSIRSLVHKANGVPVELPLNYEKAPYCGTWYMKPMTVANLKAAPLTFKQIDACETELKSSEEQSACMAEWTSQYRTDCVLTYCNSCEKDFKCEHSEVIHILTLLSSGFETC